MKAIIIINYILESISLCILLFIFCILLRKKLYYNMFAELMMYILISEILNSFSKYLSFFWNHCSGRKYPECFEMTIFGNIQLYISIFSDILSIATCLIIGAKIYDTFNNNSLFFKQRKNQIMIRISLFSFAFIISVTLGTLQPILYQDYKDKQYSAQGKCFPLNCTLANDLNVILIGILIAILMFVIIINVCNCCFLSNQSKKLNAQINNSSNKDTLNKIAIMKWRIMTFPLLSLLLYSFFYLDKIINIFMSEYLQENKLLQGITGYLFTIGDGLRGMMFSALVIWSLSDLYDVIKNCLSYKKQEVIEPIICDL